MKLLVTGSAGFIGSHLVTYLLTNSDATIVSLDALDYSGHRINLENIPGGIESNRHKFVHGSICDIALLDELFGEKFDGVINVAAHTHVDRSYYRPELFISNNVEGVLNLLRATEKFNIPRLLQVSTDEVYGAVEPNNASDENAPLRPGNFYAASKAAADLYVSAAVNAGDVDAVIIRGANNFGPRQYPEKLIPFFTRKLVAGEAVPIYGDGRQMRDWLYVEDFCRAIYAVFEKGKRGEIYNAGAGNHITNLALTRKIIGILGADQEQIRFVEDRPGHDFCYAMNCDKIKTLGWAPQAHFEEKLAESVRWYRDNRKWIDTMTQKEGYIKTNHEFFDRHYNNRK